MGKRSNFARRLMDAYQTIDPRAVVPLIPMLQGVRTFAEPCAGEGRLVALLEAYGLTCSYAGDIARGADALELSSAVAGHPDVYISNPPWTRTLMHPIIQHLMRLGPTWLLFDADWAHNVEAASMIPHCSHIVSVGRLKWMEGSPSSGKDNCAWYRFHIQHRDGPRFVPRRRASTAKGGSNVDHD